MKTFILLLITFTLSIALEGRSNPTDSLKKPASESLRLGGADTTAQKDPPLKVTGELNLSTGFYTQKGLDLPRGQFTPWGASGRLTLTFTSGFTLPFSFVYNSQNYRYRQPYNQIGVSPTYKKWLTMHAGYRNVYFSPLTLAGHTFLGGGIEINPGLFRFGAIYGKFNRAIESNFADPDRIPSFRRTGYSVRMGIGTQTNYLDFIVLKAADDLYSISEVPETKYILPAENLAIGISSRLKIAKKLTFELDGTGSVYTRDIRAEETTSKLNFKHLKIFKSLFTPRFTSQYSTAVQASLSYKLKKVGLRLQYKRIEPEFKTMGAYYFQNDIESYTIAPNFNLFKGKLKFKTSVGVQHDNLLNQKKTETHRLIGSVSLAYAPDEKLSLDALYSNYGITQKAGYLPLIDTLRIAQNNRTISLNGMYMVFGEKTTHSVSLTAIYQELEDLNARTADLNENQNYYANAGYSFQHLIANFDLNVSYSYTLTTALDLATHYYGPTLSISQRLLKDSKLSINTNLSLLKSKEIIFDFEDRGKVLNASVGVDWKIGKIHSLSLNWNLINNHGVQQFVEHRGTISYGISL